MYCRNCGGLINDKADICMKCGCRPLNGDEFCQECGAETTEKQEVCVKCGCWLKSIKTESTSFWSGFNMDVDDGQVINSNFSSLPRYYQREFQKIYTTNETYKGKFNVWAFLFGAIWALTKGCWLSALVSVAISIVTAGIGGVVYWFIFGFRGTYMYYRAYTKNRQCIM